MRAYPHGSDPAKMRRGPLSRVHSSDLLTACMISTCLRHSGLALLTTIVVLLGGLLGACGGDEKSRDAKITNPRLVQTTGGQRVFAGTLVNKGTSTITIAEIEVALYNADGSRIETMRIKVEDIPPEDSAKFSKTIASTRPIQQAQVQRVLIP